MQKLSLLDYGFLLTESPESPKHVAGLLVFELPKGYRGNFVRDVLKTWLKSDVGPPFNQKLKSALLGLPAWVEDDHLDLDYHIRHSALPRPGTMEDLMQLVSRLHARLLDRTRPLWEFHVIEGLKGRRFACYAKMHHAFIDGASAVTRLRACLSDTADDMTIRALWEPGAEPAVHGQTPPSGEVMDCLGRTIGFLEAQAKAVQELSWMFLRMGLQTAGLRRSHLPVPFLAPKTKLNMPISTARRVAVITLALQRFKEAGKATGATVNDVVLAVVDGALNRYLREKKALPDEAMVAQMPIAIRREGQRRSANQLAILLVKLGSRNAHPLMRLREIRASSAEVKQIARNLSAEAITDFTILTQGLAELLGILNIAPELPPLANVLVSNLPGPRAPLFLKGAPLLACYPISTLPPGLSLNVTIHTYGENMDVGLVADREAIPDLEVLGRHLTEFFEELEAAAMNERGSLLLAAKTMRGSSRPNKLKRSG